MDAHRPHAIGRRKRGICSSKEKLDGSIVVELNASLLKKGLPGRRLTLQGRGKRPHNQEDAKEDPEGWPESIAGTE